MCSCAGRTDIALSAALNYCDEILRNHRKGSRRRLYTLCAESRLASYFYYLQHLPGGPLATLIAKLRDD